MIIVQAILRSIYYLVVRNAAVGQNRQPRQDRLERSFPNPGAPAALITSFCLL